mmetsp:Transcript_14288/g.30008  ORF Transcript_14288/g.30008 Transcript_14288/m.30008 type:complete len:235 (+) Transcript_14288:172-876(+)
MRRGCPVRQQPAQSSASRFPQRRDKRGHGLKRFQELQSLPETEPCMQSSTASADANSVLPANAQLCPQRLQSSKRRPRNYSSCSWFCAAASSAANSLPPQQTSKTQASITALEPPVTPTPAMEDLQSLSASARSFGTQSSKRLSPSACASAPCAPKLSGHGPKSDSSAGTSAPARSRISSLVSSSGSMLKLPQCPSWPSSSGLILMIASMCLGHRFTMRSTTFGRRALTVRKGK